MQTLALKWPMHNLYLFTPYSDNVYFKSTSHLQRLIWSAWWRWMAAGIFTISHWSSLCLHISGVSWRHRRVSPGSTLGSVTPVQWQWQSGFHFIGSILGIQESLLTMYPYQGIINGLKVQTKYFQWEFTFATVLRFEKQTINGHL